METCVFYEEIEVFAPVPLHWLRRLSRGYNQSFLMAKAIRPKGIKISADLVRIRYTEQQAGCNTFSQRAKNVKGAFAVRKGHRFTGKTVCLVDDIKTSGATLNECAKVLKDAGASKVFAAVIAVAGQDKWN
ncbi:MAG: phosphoribosyltransferase family protein [Phycisphaerae bacterium]